MDPFGPNRNEFLVQPLPYSTWPTGKVKRNLVGELSARLNSHILGASFNITQPIIDTSTEIATGSSADLAVIISGPDLNVLRLAVQTLDIVKTVEGGTHQYSRAGSRRLCRRRTGEGCGRRDFAERISRELGCFENLARTRARLSDILPITVVIVFALLFVAFASVRDAALVLVLRPMVAEGIFVMFDAELIPVCIRA